ncbi:MAG TPA: hypothetical protein VJZ51_05550 [Bacilli bacterium]|nr:hypothetical protein [Bacilli bacterium]
MLLNLLTKEEKFHFIDLLVKVISIDGETNDMEIQLVNKLKYEMGDDVARYRKSNLSLEKLIAYFAEKPKVTKNLVFLNLLSGSLADEFYSVEEHFLLEQIQNSLEIPRKKRTELVKTVYADRDLREKVKRIISE